MSLMMPDSVEYAVQIPFDDWFGPNLLTVGVTTDWSAAEAQARLHSGGVLVQRAGDDEAWTEVAR
jgi:hypothetical protein